MWINEQQKVIALTEVHLPSGVTLRDDLTAKVDGWEWTEVEPQWVKELELPNPIDFNDEND